MSSVKSLIINNRFQARLKFNRLKISIFFTHFLIFLVILIIRSNQVIFSEAQHNPILIWNKTYGMTNDDAAFYIKEINNNEFIVTGASSRSRDRESQRVYIFKINTEGHEIWSKVYDALNSSEGNYIIQASDGGYLIKTHGFFDGDILKFDLNGNYVWSKKFGGPGTGYYLGSICETSDNGFIILRTNRGYLDLSKIDLEGNIEWNKINEESLQFEPVVIKPDIDGGYIIAGTTRRSQDDKDYYLINVNSQGEILWDKTYGNSSNDQLMTLNTIHDEGYVYCGFTSSPYFCVLVGKINSKGDLLWNKTYECTNNICSRPFLSPTSDGGFIVVGSIFNNLYSTNILIMKLNESGEEVWNKLIYYKFNQVPFSIMETSNNEYLIAGTTQLLDGNKAYILKIGFEQIAQKESEIKIQQPTERGIPGFGNSSIIFGILFGALLIYYMNRRAQAD